MSEQKKKFCRHYDGRKALIEKGSVCGAGVRYDSFGSEPGIFLRLPCAQGIDRKGQQEIHCEKLEFYTEEELEEREKDFKAFVDRTIKGIEMASNWRTPGVPEKYRHGVVECPECNGKLHLTQSSYNGHVHGKCDSENCISWME